MSVRTVLRRVGTLPNTGVPFVVSSRLGHEGHLSLQALFPENNERRLYLSDMVEMFRDSTEAGGRDLFACSVAQWQLLQDLGREFGWEPRGTTYRVPSDSKIAEPTFHEYAAGGPADPKIVETTDAINWARALEDRKQTLAPTGESDIALSGLVDDFIEYAYGGAFTFALSSSRA